MGKVNLNINGRAYGLGCDDGDEARLLRLGQALDARVTQIADQFGQIGDLRLMVMAGITLIDEMDEISGNVDAEVERRIGRLEADIARADEDRKASEARAATNLIKASEKIEKLAGRLASASGD